MKLQNTFLQTLQRYTQARSVQTASWEDIVARYAESHRHYHNLHHLEAVVAELEPLQAKLHSWDAIVLAVAYHDIMYDVSRQDNEAKSATYAIHQLHSIISREVLEVCRDMIIATRSHEYSANSDINYFTDADLSILGAKSEEYQQYAANIRAEYSIYPDLLYNAGRKKVLQHFLDMKQIFKTPEFYQRYEESARSNLKTELDRLMN